MLPNAGTAIIGGEPFDFAARITSDTVIHARWGLLRPMYVVFHFDGQTVSLPVVDEAIDQTQIPVPATRYGRVGVPGQAFMGWYTSIFARMHYINNPNRATAFTISQPIVPDMADASGHLNLHGSWLMYGDVNGDGVIDGIDRVLLQGFTMGEPVPIIIATADVNVDSRVDGIDRVLLQNFMLGGAVILGVPYPGHGDAGNGNAGRENAERGMDVWDGFIFEGELAGAVVGAGDSMLFVAGAVDVADIAYLNSEDVFVFEPGLYTAVDAVDTHDGFISHREIQEQTVYHLGGIGNIRTLDAIQYVNATVDNNNLQPAYVYAVNDSDGTTGYATSYTTTYTTALFNGEYARTTEEQLLQLYTVDVQSDTHANADSDILYTLDLNNTFYFASIAIEPTSATGQTGLVTRTITYTYDAARRLTREQVTGAGAITRVYTFDTRGNRTRMVVTGLENYAVTYMYDLNNRLTREEQADSLGAVSAFVFTYDRNGNQRTRAEVGAMGLETRVYNAFNQLVQFSDSAGGVTSAYGYRADGLRHSVTVNGIRMYHVWLRNFIVLERNGRREVTELYVRGVGGRLIRSHNHLWFLYNNRGDVAQRVDNAGQVLHTYRFGAFGVELNPNPNNTNPWRFNGEYHDMHRGGEIYLRARVYNARLGRFTSPDPFFHALHGNLQSCVTQAGNLYMFVMHNPVRWSDPLGLFAWNEADDHWFNLFSEVSNAGGTSSFSASTRTASINIWGVDVNFNLDDIGVRLRGVTMQVRADTFYRAIIGAATEMIFLGGHRAFDTFNAYHLHIAMFVSENSSLFNHDDFKNNERWGMRYAFLSGAGTPGFAWRRGGPGLFATSGVNLNSYFERANLQFFNHVHTGTGMIEQLFRAHAHFDAHHSRHFLWSPAPTLISPWSANSTSVALGLLNAVGLSPGFTAEQERRAVGRGSTISPRFFGVN